jgi:hypothetical protein
VGCVLSKVSLPVIQHLIRQARSHFKYVILLFPASAEELGDTAESRHAGFPGMKISEGYFPLGLTPAEKWQCPIVPLIRPGTPFADNDNAPSSSRLRFAIAAVMRKVVQPDIARSYASLQNKCG